MSSISLSQRLQALSDSYKSTLSLIQDLQKFPNGNNPLSEDLDEQRLELANSCHQSLRDAEETLELLRQEVEDLDSNTGSRRRTTTRGEERERDAATFARLSEDIRHARGAFRRAQLQSKKNLDSRKQKEREQLFANRRSGAISSSSGQMTRQKGQEKLTQDELALNAAEDVTRALRRTHALLSGNLQQSQFAQQALEESQEQLTNLSTRYAGTTDMLQKSRGLVKMLVTSQKSDTWYLQTSVYILIVTIAWLIFRRLLYGPLWWLVWLPMKWTWWLVLMIFGGSTPGKEATAVKNSTVSSGTATKLDVPRNTPGKQWNYHAIPPKGAGWNGPSDPEKNAPPSPEMVDRVAKMIREAEQGTDAVLEDRSGQERNPKKRMMELEKEQAKLKDEL